MQPGIIACARRLCGTEGALPGKAFPGAFLRNTNHVSPVQRACDAGRSVGFSCMEPPLFCVEKNHVEAYDAGKTPERTLSAVPEDVQSRRTKAQCFRLYNTSTFYDKKSGLSFTKNIRKAGKRLQKKCRRKP